MKSQWELGLRRYAEKPMLRCFDSKLRGQLRVPPRLKDALIAPVGKN
jgi:hypothetical protein